MVGDVTRRGESLQPARAGSELAWRVVSGLVLAAIAVAATYAGGAGFAALVMLIAVVMSWEWGRIVRSESHDVAIVAVHASAAVAGCVLAAFGLPLLGAIAVAIGAAVVLVLAYNDNGRWSAIGVLYVGLPAIALVWLRGGSSAGAAAILFLFAIVWTTDTFSYVCGKLIGGPKLWPWLSPNKTWAGTIGGVVCAGIAALVFAVVTEQVSLSFAATGLLLAVAAQTGDLTESALKRAFNVRNASNLIPGHGGFMDRMDGIVGAATVAAMIAAINNLDQPAIGLLQGL